jgi:hypothetical protein
MFLGGQFQKMSVTMSVRDGRWQKTTSLKNAARFSGTSSQSNHTLSICQRRAARAQRATGEK